MSAFLRLFRADDLTEEAIGSVTLSECKGLGLHLRKGRKSLWRADCFRQVSLICDPGAMDCRIAGGRTMVRRNYAGSRPSDVKMDPSLDSLASVLLRRVDRHLRRLLR